MFGGASNLAEGVDRAFIFIFAVAFFFIIGITAFMIYTVIKFRRSKGHKAKQFTGSVKLEILWTAIPFLIVMVMFYLGWMGFDKMRKVPENAMVIKAIGRMWTWEFDYGNGKTAKELVVPLNTPIKLELISKDVNHSLFIPAFRVKEDVVPGYNNYLWFTPTYLGEYDLLCSEFCGTLHSQMITKTKVIEKAEFNSWFENLVSTADIPDPEGLKIIKANNCLACHSLAGEKLVGPSFKNLFGSMRTVESKNGERQVKADDVYIKNSIYNPNDDVVKGYNKGLMQSYTDVVSDADADKIIEYLKTLHDE
jgi:cytochrome c oxidase subunit II